MRIVQTPIIKSKQKQETTAEIQKQNTEGEELDFVIHTGNNEERQKIEEGNSTQVLPAQINGNSNTKDLINRQIITKLKILQQKICITIRNHQMKARPQQGQKVKQTRKKKVTTKQPHQNM